MSPTAATQASMRNQKVGFRSVQRLAMALIAWVGASAMHVNGQPIEFFDDIGKPWYEQRNPWEERIETERHDFTQSAITVGRNVVQLESGYTFFYKDTDEEIEASHTLPEMMVRVGLSEDIEFRLRWNYAWQFIDEAPDQIGAEDLRYSLKFQITRQPCGGYLPTSALELRGTAPTGGEDFSTDQAEFGLDYIYEWEPYEGVTIAGSTGFGTNGLGDFGLIPDERAAEHFNAMSQSAVVGIELSESNTMYAEWYGIFSDGLEDEFVISVFNIGIDHYVTGNFVLDWRAGVGLSDDSDDFFTGVGGGYRF